jgi:tRNA1Val (adenine37-N6)-methyltransferase
VNGNFTEDSFLNGRIVAAQSKVGFRAGHDSVLVAAAVPALAGEKVLELGSGAGIASLCLAARVPDCTITGIEIDPELVALANANATRNGMEGRVWFFEGDVLNFSPPSGKILRQGEPSYTGPPSNYVRFPAQMRKTDTNNESLFDHVFFNPPFHHDTGQASPSATRDRAMRGDAETIQRWAQRAWFATKWCGTITAILRADRVSEMHGINTLKDAEHTSLDVLPLLPRDGEPPKRAIAQIFKGTRGPDRRFMSLILHQADGKPTEAAEAILRFGKELRFETSRPN